MVYEKFLFIGNKCIVFIFLVGEFVEYYFYWLFQFGQFQCGNVSIVVVWFGVVDYKEGFCWSGCYLFGGDLVVWEMLCVWQVMFGESFFVVDYVQQDEVDFVGMLGVVYIGVVGFKMQFMVELVDSFSGGGRGKLGYYIYGVFFLFVIILFY